MFKKTLNFSQLKTNSEEVANLEGNEVIQLLHRGKEIKVVMTQEYFFYLQAKAEENETPSKRVAHDKKKIKEEFSRKKQAVLDTLRKDT